MGYNVQIAVDSEHNLVAEQLVHSKFSDLSLLAITYHDCPTIAGPPEPLPPLRGVGAYDDATRHMDMRSRE